MFIVLLMLWFVLDVQVWDDCEGKPTDFCKSCFFLFSTFFFFLKRETEALKTLGLCLEPEKYQGKIFLVENIK